MQTARQKLEVVLLANSDRPVNGMGHVRDPNSSGRCHRLRRSRLSQIGLQVARRAKLCSKPSGEHVFGHNRKILLQGLLPANRLANRCRLKLICRMPARLTNGDGFALTPQIR